MADVEQSEMASSQGSSQSLEASAAPIRMSSKLLETTLMLLAGVWECLASSAAGVWKSVVLMKNEIFRASSDAKKMMAELQQYGHSILNTVLPGLEMTPYQITENLNDVIQKTISSHKEKKNELLHGILDFVRDVFHALVPPNEEPAFDDGRENSIIKRTFLIHANLLHRTWTSIKNAKGSSEYLPVLKTVQVFQQKAEYFFQRAALSVIEHLSWLVIPSEQTAARNQHMFQ